MRKDYQIQHSFLFEEVRLVEGGYKKEIKKYDGEGYSIAIRFSKIMKLNKQEEMGKIINSVPLFCFHLFFCWMSGRKKRKDTFLIMQDYCSSVF